MMEVMKIMTTSSKRSHCYTQCPQPCSRAPPTYTSTRDSWTLLGKFGSVSCGIIAPFSWVLVHTRFCLCLQEFVSPVLCKFLLLYGWLMGTSSKRAYAIPRSSPPRGCAPDMYLHRRYSNTVLSQSLWGLCVLVLTRFV